MVYQNLGGNDKWSSWVGWQYTSTGRVSGISGNVDRDRFTDGVLLSDTTPIPTPETPSTPSIPTEPDTITYTVKSGDTLSKIAREYGTTVNNIVSLNPSITNPNLIYPGEQLAIKTTNSSIVYTVVKGDTLSQIALKYNTSVSKLVIQNNISNPNLIYPGQKIIISNGYIPSLCNECGKVLYTIKRGDTLSKIASEYDTTVNEIATLNNISNPDLIYAGSTIRVPNCKM